MANSAQARKRARQNEKRRAHNIALKSRMRTYIKKVIAAIKDGDRTSAVDALRNAQPIIDSMVSKGLIHKNKAARHKSQLNTKIKHMS